MVSIEDCIVATNYFLFHTGATSSWNTGPPNDHTTQNGYYMYIETSWPRKYGDKAWMVSRNFQRISPGSEPCKLRFFYHMYGDSAEKLNVYIRTYRNGSSMQRVWSQVGSQGALWNRAVVQLSSNKAFQVWLILFYPLIIIELYLFDCSLRASHPFMASEASSKRTRVSFRVQLSREFSRLPKCRACSQAVLIEAS